MLHEEIHYEDSQKSKVTVRLLDFGANQLRRNAKIGLPAKNEPIDLNDGTSIYADVVWNNKPERIKDVTQDHRYKYTVAEDQPIHSELCVPLSIGQYAIGAVNLEHEQGDFYLQTDLEFVQAATTLAANTIERIRAAKVLEGVADSPRPRQDANRLSTSGLCVGWK